MLIINRGYNPVNYPNGLGDIFRIRLSPIEYYEDLNHYENIKMYSNGQFYKGSNLLLENHYHHEYSTKENFYFNVINKLTARKEVAFDNALICHDNWSKNYFHWFSELIIRVLYAYQQTLTKPILILPYTYSKISYICESLQKFKIPYYILRRYEFATISRCLIPHINIPFLNYSKKSIKLFRQCMELPKSINGKGRLIYITRENAKRRRLTNEQQVQKVLLSKGYEIISLEKLTWKDQINIVQQATTIIGLHGAGLTNILFANKELKVVELRGNLKHYNNCFFDLAHILEQNYFCLFGESKKKGSNENHYDVKINCSELERFLTQNNLISN